MPPVPTTALCAKKRKCLLSGNHCGHRWLLSFSDPLSVVTCWGVPPDAEIRKTGLDTFGVKRIVPSAPQVPPRPIATSQRARGGLPDTSIRLSLPLAKNPNERLSADQNGNVAPSVPSSGFAAAEFSGLTHRSWRPSEVTAEKTSCFPSGDRVGGPGLIPVKTNLVFGGDVICETIVGKGCGLLVKYLVANSAARISATVATAHDSARRQAAVLISTAEGKSCDAPERTSSIEMRASPIACNRWRGSFFRQR